MRIGVLSNEIRGTLATTTMRQPLNNMADIAPKKHAKNSTRSSILSPSRSTKEKRRNRKNPATNPAFESAFCVILYFQSALGSSNYCDVLT